MMLALLGAGATTFAALVKAVVFIACQLHVHGLVAPLGFGVPVARQRYRLPT